MDHKGKVFCRNINPELLPWASGSLILVLAFSLTSQDPTCISPSKHHFQAVRAHSNFLSPFPFGSLSWWTACVLKPSSRQTLACFSLGPFTSRFRSLRNQINPWGYPWGDETFTSIHILTTSSKPGGLLQNQRDTNSYSPQFQTVNSKLANTEHASYMLVVLLKGKLKHRL